MPLVGDREHGVQVRFEIDPAADRALADKVQIQQVLLNLIRNGMDAMEHSPRRELVIAAAPVDDDLLRVSVSDTGVGVDADFADQLFQPFVTSKRTGMGVGLSITRTIIETHGGRATARTEWMWRIERSEKSTSLAIALMAGASPVIASFDSGGRS